MKYEITNAYTHQVITEFDYFGEAVDYIRDICKYSCIIRNTKSGKQCNVSCSNHGQYFHRSRWYVPSLGLSSVSDSHTVEMAS